MDLAVQGQVWRRSPDAAYVVSPDRVALLDLRHLERPPYLLHGSAAVVWELLDGDTPISGIVASVSQHYAVTEEEVRDAVHAFLDELAGLGLVEAVDA